VGEEGGEGLRKGRENEWTTKRRRKGRERGGGGEGRGKPFVVISSRAGMVGKFSRNNDWLTGTRG